MIDIANSIDWTATGFRIEATYEKSREALKDIISNNPTVVFTDIKMPGMDGFELIAECRKSNVQSEFVIVSSHSDFCYAKQAIQNAVVDYCLKPINPDALKELLARIFERLDNNTAVAEKSSDFNCILDYVKENYHRQLTLNEISQAFSFHRNYICFLFKKNLNISFHHYMNTLRITKAKNLLTHTTLSIEEVAQQIGLEYFHFCKFFKKETQETPTAYRKQNAKRSG